jgi:DNA replication protein DnaC
VPIDGDADQAEFCECKRKSMWHRTYMDAGVPPQFFDCTIESDWNLNQDAYGNDLGKDRKRKIAIGEFIKKYINNIPLFNAGLKMKINRKRKSVIKTNSLLLIGGIKSGKSLLASIIVQKNLNRGLSATMYDWIHLCCVLSDYKQREEHDEIAEDFKESALIVIDGVQYFENRSSSFLFQLDRLARERMASGKPIVITGDPNYEKIISGNNWKSLLETCYKITLPTPQKLIE